MEVQKGFNPFLMDDLGSDANVGGDPYGASMASNPFLVDQPVEANVVSTSSGGGAFNPFLDMGITSEPQTNGAQHNSNFDFLGGVDTMDSNINTSLANNPFAAFGAPEQNPASSMDIFGGINNISNDSVPMSMTVEAKVIGSSALDMFGGMSSSNNFYGVPSSGTTVQAPVSAPVSADLLGGAFDAPLSQSSATEVDLLGSSPTPPEQPMDILTSEASMNVSKEEIIQRRPPPVPPPNRPPPPRPLISRETQDLIRVVTGAMESASDHLLDRLKAVKTPSPTKDLSPSPTPRSNSPADPEDDDDLMMSSEINESVQEQPRNDSLISGNEDAPKEAANSGFDIFGGKNEDAVDDTTMDTTSTSHVSPPATNDTFSTLMAAQEEVPPPPLPTPAVSSGDDLLGIFGTSTTKEEPSSEIYAPEPTVTSQPSNDFLNGFGSASEPAEVSEPVEQPEPAPAVSTGSAFADIFGGTPEPAIASEPKPAVPNEPVGGDAFDAFAARFENVVQEDTHKDAFDPFGGSSVTTGASTASDGTTWGFSGTDTSQSAGFGGNAFGASDNFDSFLQLTEPPPVPQSTPAKLTSKQTSEDSDHGGPDLSIFNKPVEEEVSIFGVPPAAPARPPRPIPPPRSPINPPQQQQTSNPFAVGGFGETPSMAVDNEEARAVTRDDAPPQFQRSESQETPPTPLFDEDVSQPLEEFPRTKFATEGWEMHLRQPNKKKITGQRFWKKVFVKLVYQGDNPVLQLSNTKNDKDPFQELPLQACYSVSDIVPLQIRKKEIKKKGAQQFDQFGKIFTMKLQYVFYKERPGVRPGQITKAERITNKLSQFAAYAIQGDYQGVKEFGSDLKKLGLPVEHAPQISQLLKLGTQSYEDLKHFSVAIEEALFRLVVHRDRALNYKTEEVQITAVDEVYVEQNNVGNVLKQIARVRVFLLAFLSGMPDIELGVNDIRRQGKEVVGRHDIIPVATEEWIRVENVEFHSCVQPAEFDKTKIIKFRPPDACYIELFRYRIRPPKNRELPLQVKTVIITNGTKIEIRSDALVPGYQSRKYGLIPCEDVAIRFPIPECWIYLFRVEKHFRYGSVKSAHRRTGKIKGIERFLGTVDSVPEPSLMEVTSGQAKYEHQHRAIVWRIPRLPKEGQGAYTTHNFVCRLNLTSFDQMPEELPKYCYVEFTMPSTQVSHTTIRSVSVTSDEPPEKYVRYLARHEYRVEVEYGEAEGPSAYLTATKVTAPPPEAPASVPEEPIKKLDSDSDSDSSG